MPVLLSLQTSVHYSIITLTLNVVIFFYYSHNYCINIYVIVYSMKSTIVVVICLVFSLKKIGTSMPNILFDSQCKHEIFTTKPQLLYFLSQIATQEKFWIYLLYGNVSAYKRIYVDYTRKRFERTMERRTTFPKNGDGLWRVENACTIIIDT